VSHDTSSKGHHKEVTKTREEGSPCAAIPGDLHHTLAPPTTISTSHQHPSLGAMLYGRENP